MRIRVPIALQPALCLWLALSGGAQVVEIPDAIACEGCAIDLAPLVTVSPPANEGYLPALPYPVVAVDRRGRVLVGPLVGESLIGVFAPDGTFVRGHGRPGGGPREFAGYPRPMVIRVLDDDSVLVVQGPYLHRLAPGATEGESKMRVDLIANDAVALGAGFVIQAYVAELGGGTPLQIVATDGTVVRGIGSPHSPGGDARSYFTTTRAIAPAADGRTVWSARVNAYELVRLDLTGKEVEAVVRRAEWFQPYTGAVLGEIFAVAQRPRTRGLFDAGSGLLWVAITHGDREFEPVVGLGSGSEGRLDPSTLDWIALLDTTIEVLDLATGSVVTRRTFDQHLAFVDAPGRTYPLLYALEADEWGNSSVRIYEGVIQRR